MCGIAGLANLTQAPLQDADADIVRRMTAYLVHRGPDDDGFLVDGPVAFGFRRLRIIDLGTGHQPIPNEDETVWAMFNGEIYNFIELRDELRRQGHTFRTQSDTEVIVHAYESYGLDFVRHLRGMFAIALWDKTQQRVVLARDRVGKKPLFYSVRGGQLAFASEIKALLPWPYLSRTINVHALHDYLSFLCVPSPDSIFEDVYKLPPAHILVADCRDGSICVQRYWRVSPTPDHTRPLSFYAEGLRELLSEAVRLRLRSDVPLGAFLSGGIDSTIIVGLMSREVQPVRTFSIGFPDKRFDETPYARLAATSFGTAHTEEIVDSNNVSPEELIKLVWHMDEPFGDSSFVPTYWLSKTAREHVTVALSGDGGDELFAGYTIFHYYQLLDRLRFLPEPARRVGEHSAGMLGNLNLFRNRAPVLSERLRQVHKALELSALGLDSRAIALTTYFDEPDKAQIYSSDWRSQMNGYKSQDRLLQDVERAGEPIVNFMLKKLETDMVDDILVKVDRASMACSLEVRSPFLDQKVVEFAMSIPVEYKLRNGMHKIVLKRAFEDLLPAPIARRGKQGFEVPFARWFQNEPWRSFLLDMLSEERIRQRGIFNPNMVAALRDSILKDPEARSLSISAYQLRHRVWLLFIFQVWYDQFMRAS